MLEVLQVTCNFIILIGATIGAVLTILKLCGVPIRFFKAKYDRAEAEKTNKLVEQVADRVHSKISEEFNEVKEQNTKQNLMITALSNSSKDMLRKHILEMYDVGKSDRKITETNKEMLDDLFNDYKAENGNHYIDKIYKRMCIWDVVPDEDDE